MVPPMSDSSPIPARLYESRLSYEAANRKIGRFFTLVEIRPEPHAEIALAQSGQIL